MSASGNISAGRTRNRSSPPRRRGPVRPTKQLRTKRRRLLARDTLALDRRSVSVSVLSEAAGEEAEHAAAAIAIGLALGLSLHSGNRRALDVVRFLLSLCLCAA